MEKSHIHQIIKILKKELDVGEMPIVSHLAESERDPFVILISTLLSLRTKDEVTAEATDRLLALACTPEEMLRVPRDKIARAIYPVGFYRNKAKTIHHVCHELIDRFDSRVPDDLDELLSIKGIGRKTANLVITLAYGKDGICVDTHVHRVSGRLGLRPPAMNAEQSHPHLAGLFRPETYGPAHLNLIRLGREICHARKPDCPHCPLTDLCDDYQQRQQA